MIEMIKAIKHCYCESTGCKGCPYENSKEKCNSLFMNIGNIFAKISEFVEFENIRNFIQTILNKGEENKDETKDQT